MTKKKKKTPEPIVEPTETVELNGDLMDRFSEKFEEAINDVIDENPEVDPRAELLITLAILAAQVACDSGYQKEEYMTLVSDMFDDYVDHGQNRPDCQDAQEEKPKDEFGPN